MIGKWLGNLGGRKKCKKGLQVVGKTQLTIETVSTSEISEDIAKSIAMALGEQILGSFKVKLQVSEDEGIIGGTIKFGSECRNIEASLVESVNSILNNKKADD